MKETKRKIIRRVAAVMLILCMVAGIVPVSTIVARGVGEGSASDGFEWDKEAFSIVLVSTDGSTTPMGTTDLTVVSSGDEIRVTMAWEILNNAKDIAPAEIDLMAGTYGLNFDDLGETDIYSVSNQKACRISVKDNKLSVEFYPEYLADTSTHTGTIKLDGKITFGDDVPDGAQKDIVLLGKTIAKIKYDANNPTSSLNVRKNLSGSGVVKENGKYYQTFQVALNAYNGPVTINSVEDVVSNAAKLSAPESISVVSENCKNFDLAASYADFEALNAALAGKGMEKNESVVLEYKMEVDSSVFSPEANGEDFSNTFKVNVTNNKGETSTQQSSERAWAEKPTVSKSGTYDAVNKQVDWTVKIDLKGMKDNSTALADILGSTGSIRDIPSGGYVNTAPFNIPAAAFTDNGDGTYTYTYSAPVNDAYFTNTDGNKLSLLNNAVSLTTKEGYTYKGTGSLPKLNSQLTVNKVFKKYEVQGNLLDWNITVGGFDRLDTSVEYITLTDSAIYPTWPQSPFAAHRLAADSFQYYIDGSEIPSQYLRDIQLDTVLSLPGASEHAYDPEGNEINVGTVKAAVRISGDLLDYLRSQGKELVIGCQSEIVQTVGVANKQFENVAVLTSYSSLYGESVPVTSKDVFIFRDAVEKSGQTSADSQWIDGNTIRYEAYVNLSVVSLVKGTPLKIKEDWAGLTPNRDSLDAQLWVYWPNNGSGYYQKWWDVPALVEGTDYTVNWETGEITFNFSDEVLAHVANPVNNGVKFLPYIKLTYTVSPDAEEYLNLLREEKGYKDYTNNIEVYYGNKKLGAASATNRLEPEKAAEKSAVYDSTTAPFIHYTVNINKNGVRLNGDNGYLEAEDVLGSALSYDIDSIKVVWHNGTEDVELKMGMGENDYSYIHDCNANSVKFKIPDGKYITITYRAIVNLYADNDSSKSQWLTEENSSNSFSMRGFNSAGTSRTFFRQAALTGRGTATSDNCKMTVNKFYYDGNKMSVPLAGTVFSVTECKYDSATDTITELEDTGKRYTTGTDGAVVVEDLKFDLIYALKEVKPANGYKSVNEINYFIVNGKDWQRTERPGDGSKYTVRDIEIAGGVYHIENQPLAFAPAQIQINKFFEGVGSTAIEASKKNICFKISDKTGKTAEVCTLENAVVNGGMYTVLVNNLLPGEYTVEEVSADIAGYASLKSEYYVGSDIDGAAFTAGTSSKVTVTSEETAYVNFKNYYEADTGKIVITKVLSGLAPADVSSAVDGIRFRVTNNATLASKSYSLEQFMQVAGTNVYRLALDMEPAGYTVEEVVTAADGYTCTTTYYVGTEDAFPDSADMVKGNKATTKVTRGESSFAFFANRYAPKPGSIVITKTVKGEVTKEQAEAVLAFTVVNNDDASDAETYALKDFDSYDAATRTWTKTVVKNVGSYTVEETQTDIAGYILTDVLHTVGTAVTASGTRAVAAVEKNQPVTVAFENTYAKEDNTGTLVLTKTVKGTAIRQEAEAALRFKVTNNDTMESVEYALKDFDSYDAVTKTWTKTLVRNAGGYTVEETVTDIDGYELSSVRYTVGQNGKTALNGETAKADNVAVAKASVTTVAFEDTYTEAVFNGSLMITKTISGVEAADTHVALANVKFKVASNSNKNDVKEYSLDDFTYVVGSNTYVLKLSKVPGDYTVEETGREIPGYETASTSCTVGTAGTMSPGTAVTATVREQEVTNAAFANVYRAKGGTITVTKTVKGDVTKEEAERALKFTVRNLSDDGDVAEYTLADFDSYHAPTNTWTKILTKDAGSYVVEEAMADIDGYTLEDVRYSVNGSTAVQGSSAKLELEKEGRGSVAFENSYAAKPGMLVITKTVEGNVNKKEAESALKFAVVSKENPEDVREYALADFDKYVISTNTWTKTIELPGGEYTVQEIGTDIDGYEPAVTTYCIDGAKAVAGKNAAVSVTKGATTEVAYTNRYDKIVDPATLVITKTYQGITRKEAEDTLQFTVMNNETKVTKKYTLKDFDYDETTGVYTLELKVAVGSYTIEESKYNVDGYTLTDLNHAIDGGKVTLGPVTELTLTKNTKVAVNYKGIYEKAKETPIIPETGDTTPVAMYIALLVISAIALVCIAVLFFTRRKKHKK